MGNAARAAFPEEPSSSLEVYWESQPMALDSDTNNKLNYT